MRMLSFLKKTFLENLRDWKILILTLVFAPFFVFLMYAYYGVAPSSYVLLVYNRDRSAGAEASASQALIAAWREFKHADGQPVFRVSEVTSLESARLQVKNRDADLLVEILPDFSRHLANFKDDPAGAPARLINHGNESNLRSSMAMALSDYIAYALAITSTGTRVPLEAGLQPAGTAAARRDFDLYVPALLVLAIIMVLFTAAATLIKEVDQGTMSRLLLSRLTTLEFLTAVSLNQVLIGLATLLLALLAALCTGYRMEGSLAALLVAGTISILGVVAISVLVAAFLKSIFELLTVGCFPFFILMFFSEAMFPLPKLTLFQLAGYSVYASDILPTSLTVRAFQKILNGGAGLAGIGFELAGILALTALYYVLGAWLFRRRHQRV